MKKNEVVKNNLYFNQIIQKGIFVKNEYFVIYIMKTKLEKPHFGIAVGKKIGNAVIRNKIKRQIRNIIDNNKLLFPNNNDYIIMIKKSVLNEKFKTLNESFNKLVKEKVNK